jgi:hypothetical protein
MTKKPGIAHLVYPGRTLPLCRNGRAKIKVTPAKAGEYERVCELCAARQARIDVADARRNKLRQEAAE